MFCGDFVECDSAPVDHGLCVDFYEGGCGGVRGFEMGLRELERGRNWSRACLRFEVLGIGFKLELRLCWIGLGNVGLGNQCLLSFYDLIDVR